jgi:quercetin dioxygenase-like cupin family protein
LTGIGCFLTIPVQKLAGSQTAFQEDYGAHSPLSGRFVPTFDACGALAGGTSAAKQGTAAQPVINKAATAHFGTLPVLPSCATFAVESGAPNTGPSVLLVKLTPRCDIPWHWHTPNESVMVVSETIELQAKGQKAAFLRHGDFGLMPSRHVHFGKAVGTAPCTFFLYADGAFDIHYVDPVGKEIPVAEALKAAQAASSCARTTKREAPHTASGAC